MKFSSPENQKIIEKFVETGFSHLQAKYPQLYVRAVMSQEIVRRLGSLGQDGAECDLDSCSYNKAHRGDSCLQVMQQATSGGRAHQITSQNLEILINVLYADAIRFLKEYELTLPPDRNLAMELNGILTTARKGAQGHIDDNEKQFNLRKYKNIGVIQASLKEIIWWALYEMPQEVLKGKIAALPASTGWAEKLDAMQKDIEELQMEIEELRKEKRHGRSE